MELRQRQSDTRRHGQEGGPPRAELRHGRGVGLPQVSGADLSAMFGKALPLHIYTEAAIYNGFFYITIIFYCLPYLLIIRYSDGRQL